jgi:hypothetical protein
MATFDALFGIGKFDSSYFDKVERESLTALILIKLRERTQ